MSKLISLLFGSRSPAAAGIRENLKTASISQLADWSRHDDGFIREGVLVRAVELRSPALLDAILERLNDWVPQVRQAARTALLTLLPFLQPSAILKTLPIIGQLRLAKRENHAAWIHKYHATVIDALGSDALIAETVMGTGEIARSCFEIVEGHGLLTADRLAQRVLENGRDFATSLAAWRLGTALDANERRTLADIGLGSPFGAVRTLALREALTCAGEQAERLAEQSLLDPQSSVREAAIWHLKQTGYPVAQFYVDSLTQSGLGMRKTRICLVALATCGTRDHIAIIKRFADIPNSRTQATAVMSWARLDHYGRNEILRCALRSPFARVRKLTAVLMDEYGAYIDLEEALKLAEEKSDHALAMLLVRREPWTWITTILTLANSPAGSLGREDLIRELKNWLAGSAHVYTKPTAAQVTALTSPTARRMLKELIGPDALDANGAFRHIFGVHGLNE